MRSSKSRYCFLNAATIPVAIDTLSGCVSLSLAFFTIRFLSDETSSISAMALSRKGYCLIMFWRITSKAVRFSQTTSTFLRSDRAVAMMAVRVWLLPVPGGPWMTMLSFCASDRTTLCWLGSTWMGVEV